ncbi:hypothetical protein Tco_1372678 [Tanacetum coccineum]
MSLNTSDYIYPIIVPSNVNIEDAFSSTNTPDYTSASPDYSPASLGNTSPNPSDDLTKDLLASLVISPYYDDLYIKVMQAYNSTSKGSPISLSPSSSIGSSSPIRSTTPPPDYPFDESIFAELYNSLWIIPRPLGSEPVPDKPNEMAPKRTSTFAAPLMTQAAIKKLVADSVAAALEA